MEFVVANKVANIINCAGRQVPNHWESIGVKYLTYFWFDQDDQIILDVEGKIANECYNFITAALQNGDSILVHSVKGQGRAFTIVAMWIMRRYQWSLAKTLEFLNSRRTDLEIRPNFIHQLNAYENRLATQGLGPKTTTWNDISEMTNSFENEELLLRNTYINAQSGPMAILPNAKERGNPPKLRWTDESKVKTPLATIIDETNNQQTTKMNSITGTKSDQYIKEAKASNYIEDNRKPGEKLAKTIQSTEARNAMDIYSDIMHRIEGKQSSYDQKPIAAPIKNTTDLATYNKPGLGKSYTKEVDKYGAEIDQFSIKEVQYSGINKGKHQPDADKGKQKYKNVGIEEYAPNANKPQYEVNVDLSQYNNTGKNQYSKPPIKPQYGDNTRIQQNDKYQYKDKSSSNNNQKPKHFDKTKPQYNDNAKPQYSMELDSKDSYYEYLKGPQYNELPISKATKDSGHKGAPLKQYPVTKEQKRPQYTETKGPQYISSKQPAKQYADEKEIIDTNSLAKQYINTKDSRVSNSAKNIRSMEETKYSKTIGKEPQYIDKKSQHTEDVCQKYSVQYSNVGKYKVKNAEKYMKNNDKKHSENNNLKYRENNIRPGTSNNEVSYQWQGQFEAEPKIAKSINQMMDLNNAMNKKLYQETSSSRDHKSEMVQNYYQPRKQSYENIEQEPVIKKVIPGKRATNVRPSSATVKRDPPISSTSQK